jgi:hypothetical protein
MRITTEVAAITPATITTIAVSNKLRPDSPFLDFRPEMPMTSGPFVVESRRNHCKAGAVIGLELNS